jgi:hypothetical protein
LGQPDLITEITDEKKAEISGNSEVNVLKQLLPREKPKDEYRE